MIIDIHGHVSAPQDLYAWKSLLMSSDGYHGKGLLRMSDEQVLEAGQKHIEMLRGVGTDMQFLSPRPFHLMHSWPTEKVIRWWVEVNNDIIGKQSAAFPDTFKGVCGLPQGPSMPIEAAVEELERCVNELGFIGCLINPDPTEGTGYAPTLDDEFWYPLYAKMVELDVPALIHSTACHNHRESYSAHFITEESIAVLKLTTLECRVFEDFPSLRIIVSHGGGSVPYQVGRWRAGREHSRAHRPELESFDESMRKLWYDTVLYNQESIELLLKIVGTDRCMFGTELPGSGSSRDPERGEQFDNLRPVIEAIDFLDDAGRRQLFEENAKTVFPRLEVPAAA
jgi:predicted TIM-barrel fold metal-dependent hydrolase